MQSQTILPLNQKSEFIKDANNPLADLKPIILPVEFSSESESSKSVYSGVVEFNELEQKKISKIVDANPVNRIDLFKTVP